QQARLPFKAPRDDDFRFRAELDCSQRGLTIQLQRNMTTPCLIRAISRSPLRLPLLLILLVFACFALSQNAQCVVPPPDGGYPGGNTAEGTKALLSQSAGGYNAASGWFSLESLTTGSFNTGVGAGTLALNNGDQN